MSTLTAETTPTQEDEVDWLEVLSKTDHDSWSRSRGRRTFSPISSTAMDAKEHIVWIDDASLPGVLRLGDIALTIEIDADLAGHGLAGSLSNRVSKQRVKWVSTAHSVGTPALSAWASHMGRLDRLGQGRTRFVTDWFASENLLVNVGNATLRRGHLERWISGAGIEIAYGGAEIASHVDDLLLSAENELAETGSAETFGHRLQAIIREAGVPALDVIAQTIQRRGVRDFLVFEALRNLGMLEHPPSYRRRFDLLVDALNSQSAMVRDGAGLGLAFLDDPAAIPHLERAVQIERVAELKDDLQLVLDQLVETAKSAPPA